MFSLQKKLIAIVSVVVILITAAPTMVLAQDPSPDILITFENLPLFSEANFLPGDTVTRWVKVKNNWPDSQPMAVIVEENYSDPDGLATQLDLVIMEGATTLYTGTLAGLHGDGLVNLSNLPSDAETQYDFSVTFNELSSDNYQGAVVSFDLELGLFSDNEVCTESCDGGIVVITSTGGGGGPAGLYIHTEQVGDTSTTSATITWFTNLSATSRVVYDIVSHPIVGVLPNLGYSFSTAEDPTLTTYHTMVISGLTSNTTYYFRPVSANVSNTVSGIELAIRTGEVAGAYTESAGGATPGGVAFVSPTGAVAGAQTGALAQGEPELVSEPALVTEDDVPLITPGDCTNYILLLLILNLIAMGLLWNKFKDSEVQWHKYLWLESLLLILLPILIWYPICQLWIWLLILLVIELLVLFLLKNNSAGHIEPPVNF
ncbi:MAG: fibronectin type III domain-containing protein [Patescibacteria group bacterium]